jgi:hypothetical protein
MYYSSEDDLIRCKGVVENLLNKRNIDYTDEQLTEITKDIMGVSYSHGGDYSNDMIIAFGKGYLDHELHKKFLK